MRRRALPSSGDGPCLHLATGLAFIWRRARIHLATGADSSAANQGEAAPARAVWRAGSRPDQATEGETADSRIEAKARTWPGRGNVPCLHLATGLAFIWRRALPSSGDGRGFIWRRARIHRQRIRARPHRRGPSGGQDRDRIRRPKARPPTPGLKRRRGPGRGAGTCQS